MMQFIVNKNDILSQLQKVSKAVSTRTTNPMLSHILFYLNSGILTLRATDLEITMSSTVPVSAAIDGEVAIPARLILDIINEVDDEDIFIESNEVGEVSIKTSRGKYEIMGKPGEEFPGLPEVKEVTEFEIEKKVLLRLIQKTIIAVSKDELKAALTGVLFQIKEGEIRSVATDGHRLVCLIRKDFVNNNIQRNVIIPPKFLNLISSYLNEDGKLTVYLSENHIKVNVDTITIYSRLIDERFPDYESVIPIDNDKILKVKVSDLIPTLRRVSILANKITHQISLQIKPEEMLVSVVDYETRNSANEKVFVDFTGEEILIGFNVEYLKEIIRNIDTENVVMKLRTPISASLIVPEVQNENEEIISLLMPVRISD